jgi:hypothetical protein
MADIAHAVAQSFGSMGLKPRAASKIIEDMKALGFEFSTEEGFLSVSQTGTQHNPATVLSSYFKQHPEQFHGHAGEIKFKSDLGNDSAAKSRWISEHGFQAWNDLPATPNSPTAKNTITPVIASTEMTQKEWKQLTASERSAAISSWGADALHNVEVIMARRG